MSFRFKILLLMMITILPAGSVPLVVATSRWAAFRSDMKEEVDHLGQDECAKVVRDVYLMLRAHHEKSKKELRRHLSLAAGFVQEAGGLSLSTEQVRWKVVDQFSKETAEVELPKMMLGNQWLGRNADMKTPSPIVDEVSRWVGVKCTIFQCMPRNAGLVRVCTNVEQRDGTRAVGTYLPTVHSDGEPNSVVAAVLRGETHIGRAFVVGEWYLTVYQPVYGADRRVIGAIFCGLPLEDIPEIRQGIQEITVGKTGYAYVLGGSKEQRGRYIISHHGSRDGESIYDSQDASGRYFIREMIDAAVRTRNGESHFTRYAWRNPGEEKPRLKVTAATYFEPWDWVIGAGAYEDDYQDALQRIDHSVFEVILWSLLGTACAFGVCVWVAWGGAERITRPLRETAAVMKKAAAGDYSRRLKVESKDELGEVAQAVNSAIEATENALAIARDAAEALRRSECNYREIFNASRDAVLLCDPTTGIVVEANSAAAALFGCELDALIGRPVGAWGSSEGRHAAETLEKKFQDAMVEGAAELRWHVRRKDGETLWTFVTLAFTRIGERDRMMVVLRDVTERDRLIGELEAKNAELEQFNYTVSHDLKSPLLTITGFVQMIANDIRKNDFSRIPNRVERITSAAAKMTRLMDDLLKLSRVGRVCEAPTVVDFGEVVREAVELVGGQIRARGVQVKMEPEFPMAYGDRTRLLQVVQNLLDNAVKHMKDRPNPQVELGVRLDGREAVFYIKDNGPGIDPRDHKRIFGLFEKLDAQSEGSGVGLALVRRIVESLGSRIWVESEGLGYGSTFCFVLPRPKSEIAGSAAPSLLQLMNLPEVVPVPTAAWETPTSLPDSPMSAPKDA